MLNFLFKFVPLALAQVPSQVTVGGGGGGTPVPLPTQQVAQIYKLSLLLGGILALAVIVWAAARYTLSAGNPSTQSDARDQILQAFLGLLLLFGAGLVLQTVNPALINPSLVTIQKIPVIETGVLTGGGKCEPVKVGQATAASLEKTCFVSNSTKASSIANAESGGVPGAVSTVDKCTLDGNSVSFGLFQINISSNYLDGPNGRVNCPKAFSHPYTGSTRDCKVIDPVLYARCKDLAFDPQINIANACRLSDNGNNWGPWGANSKCGF